MILICPKNKCTGCAACANICPKGCISMEPSVGLGHLFPRIHQDSCIECHACENVCPSINPLKKSNPKKAFAGWFINEKDYFASSSGGAATALSKSIIRNGGIVYGCAMLPGIKVQHIRVDKEENLERLRGSKYTQSTIGLSYKNVKQDLSEAREVLFIGTPCQIAGLKSFLGREYNNLYTIDLVCHGVPSNNLLKKEILKVTKGIEPDNVIFRKNSQYLMSFEKNGREIYKNSLFKQRYNNLYYNAFFDGFTFRDSCYECPYACPERLSDLTIGDFWGVDADGDLPIKHENGCSLLLSCNDKGKKLLCLIEKDFYLFEKNFSVAINGNDQLQHPKLINCRISLFRKIMKYVGISFAYRLCILDKIFKYKVKHFFCK